jgi:hypothetical protein
MVSFHSLKKTTDDRITFPDVSNDGKNGSVPFESLRTILVLRFMVRENVAELTLVTPDMTSIH